MINTQTNSFSLWTPVTFTELPKDSFIKNCVLQIGSWADQYAYLGSQVLDLRVQLIDIKDVKHLCIEVKKKQEVSIWLTTLKITTYAFTFFILPVIALPIKMIFKTYLNTCLKKEEERMDNPLPVKYVFKKSPNKEFAEKKIGRTKIKLLTGSLLDETTEAIVNAANLQLVGGLGVCAAVRKSAGIGVFTECKEILQKNGWKSIQPSQAVLTSSGELYPQVKTIVHTVGPDCRITGQNANRVPLLKQAYKNSLEIVTNPQKKVEFIHPDLLSEKPMRSIAFPSISTGIYAYKVEEAAPIALQAIKEFITENPDSLDEVRFVFLPLALNQISSTTYLAYQTALESL